MIKEQNRIFRRVQIFSDLSLVIVSFFMGYFLRDKMLNIYPFSILEKYLWDEQIFSIGYYALYVGLLPVMVFIWGGLLSYFGMYRSAGVHKASVALLIVFKTTIIGFVLLGSYIFVLRMQEDISRLFIGFTFLSAAFLISLEKILLVYIVKVISKRNASFKSSLIVFRRILVVGTNRRAKQFMKLINNNPDWGIRIVGVVDIKTAKQGEMVSGYEILGTLDDMPDLIVSNVIDEVVFIVPRLWLNKIEEIVLYCERMGLTVHVAVNLFQLKFSQAKQTDLQGFPLLTFETTTVKLGHLFVKRVFDFAASGFGLLVLIPFFLFISGIIKMTSKGPIFFRQKRCTLFGREFYLYKFRTMVFDAESKLKDLIESNEMDGPVFKMANDPRITKIGKFLRKFSIDELPQLWNVFKGDMSLVGPRPPLPHEVEKYDVWQRRRLSMRPGITCIWQAGGRNDICDFKEWMKLDLEYIDNWSLMLDFKILFKTIPVVLFGIGAR